MTTQTQPNKPGFFARLFRAFFKLLILVVVLAALAVGAWFGYKELDRSFASVVTRADINTRRIEESSGEVDDLLAIIDGQHDEIIALQTAVADQNDNIATLTEELAAERNQRDETVTALDAQISGSIVNDITALNENLVALQSDITNNGAQIDELGGTADGLQGAVASLQDNVTSLQENTTDLDTQIDVVGTTLAEFPAAEIARMRQTLALFRLWELTSRAHLRLAEGNAGLAAIDVESALAEVNGILENEADSELAAVVLPVQERLTLAAASLPVDPETAVRDLDTVWEALDAALAELLTEAEGAEETSQ